MSFWDRFDNPLSDAPKTQGHEGVPAPDARTAEPASAPHAATPAETKREQAPASQAAAVPATTPQNQLRLGQGVRLEGKLTFSGTVRIDATFKGSITTDGVLVVAEGARVDAEISCGTVVIEGELNGNVSASSAVELRATARLHGDVETPALAIDRGAIFEGASRRPQAAGAFERRLGKPAAASEHLR